MAEEKKTVTAPAAAAKPAPKAAPKKERMILDAAYQPQVKTVRTARSLMLDVIIALIPSIIVAVIQYGVYPLAVIAVSAASAAFFEWGYRVLLKKNNTVGDLSACLTGILLALTLPANTPLWIPVIGTFFAIVVVKQLYGGIGKNFLNPALAGRAFLLASYGVFLSGKFGVPKALAATVDGATMATPLADLFAGSSIPKYLTMKNLLVGAVPGCIGELSVIAILMGAAYLLITGVITWHIPVSFVGTVAALTVIFGREGYSNVNWMLLNVMSGSMLFGACFMATDYASSPLTPGGQLVYGFGCGVMVILIRYFGGYPEGTTYAILLMNVCAWAIDKFFRRRQLGGYSRADQSIIDKAAKYSRLAKEYSEKAGDLK